MNDSIAFSSCLGNEMQSFLAHRKTVIQEHAYGKEVYYLHDFDDYLVSVSFSKNDTITEELIAAWICSHDTLADRTIASYVKCLRQFLMFYRIFIDSEVFVPPCPDIKDNYVPYLFSDSEMESIYKIADSSRWDHKNTILPFIRNEFPTVLRLLDTAGLRIGEAVSLKMNDVSLADGVLTMKNTKNDRQRFVPLSGSMSDILRRYCTVMNLPQNTELPLFPRRSYEEPLLWYDIYDRFNAILVRLGIYREGAYIKSRGPCLHCLRHRFVMKSLKRLISQGIPFNEAMTYISVYAGHVGIAETEQYMKFAADLFPEELEKFEQYSQELYPDEDYWDEWL